MISDKQEELFPQVLFSTKFTIAGESIRTSVIDINTDSIRSSINMEEDPTHIDSGTPFVLEISSVYIIIPFEYLRKNPMLNNTKQFESYKYIQTKNTDEKYIPCQLCKYQSHRQHVLPAANGDVFNTEYPTLSWMPSVPEYKTVTLCDHCVTDIIDLLSDQIDRIVPQIAANNV